jgi:hypothetical protein
LQEHQLAQVPLLLLVMLMLMALLLLLLDSAEPHS